MPLAKLTFKPGINKETTSYGNEMGWFDSSLIRFRKGRPEKMGGWAKLSANTILGTVRSLFPWVALDGTKFMAMGTSEKFYIEHSTGVYSDVTPLRGSAVSLTNPFTTVSGSSVVTVADDDHGAAVNDYVTFASADLSTQGIASDKINTNLKIQSIIDADNYTVDTDDNASASASGVGGSVTAEYEINTGLNAAVAGGGYGAGEWGGQDDDFKTTLLNGAVNTTATTITVDSATDFAIPSTTTANGNIAITDIIITLADSSGFPAKGTIKIGSENIIYENNGTSGANQLSGLTRGADGTTAAAHSSGATVSFLGLIQVNNELMLYASVSSNDLQSITRSVRGTHVYSGTDRSNPTTANSSHADDSTVILANDFTGWGDATDIGSFSQRLRLWFQDNYGEDLFFNPIDDTPYFWDRTLTTGTRATALSAQAGASQVPTITRQIMISGEDRHVVCMGCNELGSTTQNLLRVRWSDQENPFEWNPTLTNTAGGITLSSGSEIIRAVRTRQEILIYTDVNTHVMRFVGPPNIFSFALAASNTSLISPNAVVAVADKVFWMSRENFHVYTGRSEVLPCTVLRHIFDDLNTDQTEKICAGSNKMFDEVFWFYPSSGSEENDRYVKFNFTEGTWDIGTLSRSAWMDFGIHNFPRGAETENSTTSVYVHENSNSADGDAMNSFVESADFDLDPDGNNFMFISRLIPDVSLNSGGQVDYVIKTRDFPGDTLATNSTHTVSATTQQSFLRSRSRQAAVRIESNTTNTTWTLGDLRLDIRPDGRK